MKTSGKNAAHRAAFTLRFASGETTPTKELERSLARLDQIDHRLKSFVYVARDAALEAAAQSDRRWRAKKPLSAVDGMPIGLKDVIETADMPTGQGSPMWNRFETQRDAAAVQALREAGVVIVGKTSTTEFAATEPLAETCNPHDHSRTPGGSSSGSAAAVGAGIVPAALGTQVVGSTLRPASYCGCVGFKPTFGALNRGGCFDQLSQSCLGILAETPEDAWLLAAAIAERVGGDPGCEGLQGPGVPPAPLKPQRLAVLHTAGWEKATTGAREAFIAARGGLVRSGVEVKDRKSDPGIRQLEEDLSDAVALTFRIFDWELRWPLGTYAKRSPNGLSVAMWHRLENARSMTLDDYRAALRAREAIRAQFAYVSPPYDAFVTLAATGAAPVGLSWTGDPSMNVPASLLGAPAVSLPLLSDDELPLGLQLIGAKAQDARLMGIARWICAAYRE